MSDWVEARLLAQRELSRVLASARDVRSAAPAILQAVSRPLRCVVSEMWLVDEARAVLASVGNWTESDGYRTFAETDTSFEFVIGRGLPGLAWERQQPQWMSDVTTDAVFERRLPAVESNVHAAVAFPIVFGGAVSGVVQFFYREARPIDPTLIETFSDIGEQLGLFIERARIDALAMRQAAEILELSAPILRVARHALLLPVIGAFDARRAVQVTERLLTRVIDTGARWVVLDMTSAGEMDTFMAQRVLDTIAAVKLLGAQTILTGVRPNAARTLVLLGIEMKNVMVCSSLADGIAIAQKDDQPKSGNGAIGASDAVK